MTELRCAECDCRFGGIDCNWIETSDWRKIDTAPKDGTIFLGTGLNFGKGPDRHYVVAEWLWDDFYSVDHSGGPLHYLDYWQPLPKPPRTEQT